MFELSVDIRLIDRIENGPEKYRALSDFERLRSATRIVEFHSTNKVEEPLAHLSVYEQFINGNGGAVAAKAKELWPTQSKPRHWSGKDLRDRAMLLGAPFHEIYDVHYAELSWYAHPGVAAIASFEARTYPLVCASGYEVGTRCYRQTLLFMIDYLGLRETDAFIDKKLEWARMAAFAQDEEAAIRLRRVLLGY